MSTSVSGSPPNGSKNAASGWKSAKYWIVFGATAGISLIGFFVIRSQGSVRGTEFAPSHFQTRSFSFYEIPLVHLQITPIKRKVTTSKAARYLLSQNLIQSTKRPPDDWHLASLSRALAATKPQDASFLTTQLELSRQEKSFWKTWTEEHPLNAQVAWPIVQRLAKRELYLMLPGLFELMAGSSKADGPPQAAQFQRQIDDYLRQQYAGLIRDLHQAGRESLAADFLTEAQSDFPDDVQWAHLSREMTAEPSPPEASRSDQSTQ